MALTGDTDGTVVAGTAIALGDRAVLLRGPSGAGKSDLALRAMAAALGGFNDTSFRLVGDDQVVVRGSGGGLMVQAHPRLAGLLEVRGLGILPVTHAAEAELVLIAEITVAGEIERLPDPWPSETLLGVSLPVMRIAAFEASAPLKLALALLRRPWHAVAD